MEEAVVTDPYAYVSFNDFFTRALNPEARPISLGLQDFVSPADATISQLGLIYQESIIQAKNHSYTTSELLGGDAALASHFYNGTFITLYLAPHNYHRVHMPLDGYLSRMIYIPGTLFSVNAETTAKIPNLFARNERVVCIFNTSIGKVAIILVGAMIVGSIETVWAGTIQSTTGTIQQWKFEQQPIFLRRGEEMGRFKLGSTVIVLLEKEVLTWKLGLDANDTVQMGQSLGKTNIGKSK